MNNNLNKLFSNDSDDYFNNGQLSSSSGNYLNDNNYLRNKSNRQNINFIDSCKNLAIVYIVLWTIMVIFYIVITPFFESYHYVTRYYYVYYGHYYSHGYYDIDFNIWNACFIASGCVGGIIGFALLILGFFLIGKTMHLKSFYSNYINKGLFVWFWIGLVLGGLPSFIGSILTIVSCNNVKRQCFNDFELANNKYSNDTVNTHDFLSVDACKWLSVSYIVSCLSLFLLIIICSVLICVERYNISDSASLLLIVSGSIIGILLFILSIVLTIQTKFCINLTKGLFIWFVLGLFLIPSFIGSIITIVRCDWIRNKYLDDWNFIKDKKINVNYDINNQYNLNNISNDFSYNSKNSNYWNIQNINSSHNNVVSLIILSLAYIMTWVFLVAFMIGAVCCFDYFDACVISHTAIADQYKGFIAGFILCIALTLSLSIVLLVLGIYLISKTNGLKNYYSKIISVNTNNKLQLGIYLISKTN